MYFFSFLLILLKDIRLCKVIIIAIYVGLITYIEVYDDNRTKKKGRNEDILEHYCCIL